MSKSGIYLDIDDTPVDLAELHWEQIAPCGCISAVHIAFSDYGRGEPLVITTAEQAALESTPSKAEREQDAERGFVWRVGRRADIKGWKDCPHSPKWGVEPRPLPDGMRWAAGGWHDNRTRTLHLVPESVVTTEERQVPWAESKATTLCGTEKYPWSSRWHEVDGKVECKRCWKKAVEALAVSR